MKVLILLLSFCVYAIASEPTRVSPEEGSELVKAKKCEMQISFGSYGSGTPSKVIKKINDSLKDFKGITDIKVWSWGLEGEFDYCLNFESTDKLKAAQEIISKHIPEYSKDGYTTLLVNGTKLKQTTWPKN